MKAAVFWGAVLIALIAAHFYLLNETLSVIPDTALFSNQGGLGVSVSDIPDANISYSARITSYSTLSTQVPPKSVNAKFVYANAVPELQMINGAFPSTPKMAVISDTLAVKWFFSTDVLGAELLINGEVFNICGVFRDKKSFLGGQSQENVVYLPLSAYPDSEAQITEIWTPLDGKLPEQALDNLAMSFDKRIQPAEIVDYQSNRKLAEQSKLVLWFCLGVPVAVALFVSFGKRAAALFRDVRTIVKGYEPFSWSKTLIFKIVWCLLCLLAGIGIVLLVLFEPYLPNEWIQNGINTIDYSLILLYATDVLALAVNVVLIRAVIRMRK